VRLLSALAPEYIFVIRTPNDSHNDKGTAMIRKVKFVTIPVRDQDRAFDFYVNTLGFSVITDQPMGPGLRWIELKPAKGDTGVALYTPPGHENRIGGFTGISFEVDDVQKTYDELSAKGVEFAQVPKAEAWGTMAIMKDSEGNQIVLGTGR
jgi:predicted enzyme related to lactoylglutathione lyase